MHSLNSYNDDIYKNKEGDHGDDVPAPLVLCFQVNHEICKAQAAYENYRYHVLIEVFHPVYYNPD